MVWILSGTEQVLATLVDELLGLKKGNDPFGRRSAGKDG